MRRGAATDECLDEVTEPFPSRLMTHSGYPRPRWESTVPAVGSRIFVIFLGAILNQPLITLGVVAMVMNAEVIRRIAIFGCAPKT